MPIVVTFGRFDGVLDYTGNLACHRLSGSTFRACGFDQSPCRTLELRRWKSCNRPEHGLGYRRSKLDPILFKALRNTRTPNYGVTRGPRKPERITTELLKSGMRFPIQSAGAQFE